MIKDWTGGNSGFYSVNHRKKEIEVEEYDFYCTHPESIKLFLKAAKNTNLIIPNNIFRTMLWYRFDIQNIKRKWIFSLFF